MSKKALILTAILLVFSACKLQAAVTHSTWVGGEEDNWGVLVKVGEILPLSIIPRTVCLKCSVNNQSPSAIVKIIHNSKAMQGEISNIKSPKWLKIINDKDSEDGSVRLLLKVLPEFIPKLSIISGKTTANIGLNAFPVDIPVLVFTQQ